MRILVTGGTGFIGSHVVETLQQADHRIHCLVVPGENRQWLQHRNVVMHHGDLRHLDSLYESVRGIDCVYHLAGVKTAWSEESYVAINVDGTKNLIEACLKVNPGVQRFVYVSSQAAAGPSPDGHRVTEEEPCRPITAYGRSKCAAEEYLRRYMRQVPITIVRPALTYGPRDTDVWTFFKLVRRGVMLKLSRQEQYLNLLHVDDLAHGIVWAGMHDRAAGQIYFLTSQEGYTSSDIAQAIWRAAGRRGVYIPIPSALVQALLRGIQLYMRVTGRRMTLLGDKILELTQCHWVCSGEKAKRELGFTPQIALAGGVRQTLRWYDAHPEAQRLRVKAYR
jgi:dihydroflavonol-4-reductase